MTLSVVLGTLGSAAASETAAAAAPYPQSKVIPGITWDRSSYRSAGDGGDIWAVTSASDGAVYTAWGDGAVAGCRKVSYGTAAITGGPGTNLRGTGCGPTGQEKGKITALLATGTTLYAVVNTQDRTWPGASFAIWRSGDRGKSWQKPNWTFAGSDLRPEGFVNFGPGNSGARDGYAYLTAFSAAAGKGQKSIYLMRVPAGSITDKSAYEYFTGGSGGWTKNPGAASPIFTDRSGAFGANMVYDAGVGRYLLTAARGSAGRLGVFEAPEPWGPWSTVDYESAWLGIRKGEFLGVRFPTKWMADGGSTLWAVFSCYNCGEPFHDRFNLIRATLKVNR